MPTAKIGRPRSEKAREKILAATSALLDEGGSGMTIEAIARRAGVGKPTIYRWWPTMADIVLEALLDQADTRIPIPSYTNLRDTLREFLRRSVETLNAGSGVHLRFLMAQAQLDDGFRDRFRDHFVAGRRAVLRSILDEASERGDLAAVRDREVLVDVMFGAMWYRLLVGHASMDARFADELSETVAGIAAGGIRS